MTSSKAILVTEDDKITDEHGDMFRFRQLQERKIAERMGEKK